MSKIIEVKTKEQLKELYDDWSLTMCGLNTDEKNLKDFADWLDNNGGTGKGNYTFYITKGKTMNEICKLVGENAYQEDLNIVAIKSEQYTMDIAVPRLEIDGKWMADIIENNARRNGNYKPF